MDFAILVLLFATSENKIIKGDSLLPNLLLIDHAIKDGYFDAIVLWEFGGSKAPSLAVQFPKEIQDKIVQYIVKYYLTDR